MHLVPLQRAVIRIHTTELNVLTQIVPAHPAQEALSARHTGLHGHAVARLQACDALAAPDDHARCFVAQDAVSLEDERADAAGLPEVDIRAAYACRFDVDEAFVRPGGVDGRFGGLELVVCCDLEGRVGVWCLEDGVVMFLRM